MCSLIVLAPIMTTKKEDENLSAEMAVSKRIRLARQKLQLAASLPRNFEKLDPTDKDKPRLSSATIANHRT